MGTFRRPGALAVLGLASCAALLIYGASGALAANRAALAALRNIAGPNENSLESVCLMQPSLTEAAADPQSSVPVARGRLWSLIGGDQTLAGVADLPAGPADRVYEPLLNACSAIQRGSDDKARDYLDGLTGAEILLRRWGLDLETAGDVVRAGRLLALAAKLDRHSGETHYIYADFLRRHGGSAAAILSELRAAAELSPQFWAYRASLGEAQFAVNDFRPAAEAFTRAIALAPEKVSLYVDRGRAYAALGQQELACQDYYVAFEAGGDSRAVAAELLCKTCGATEECNDERK